MSWSLCSTSTTQRAPSPRSTGPPRFQVVAIPTGGRRTGSCTRWCFSRARRSRGRNAGAQSTSRKRRVTRRYRSSSNGPPARPSRRRFPPARRRRPRSRGSISRPISRSSGTGSTATRRSRSAFTRAAAQSHGSPSRPQQARSHSEASEPCFASCSSRGRQASRPLPACLSSPLRRSP